MRLKSLFVSNYKNLKNFTLSFDGTSFIDVFVGKNGSGKSNLFEALIEIFRHLDQFGRPANEISFDYLVSYEIEEQETEIEWKAGKLRINKDEDRKTLGQTPFPDNVLIYYSGHNTTVTAAPTMLGPLSPSTSAIYIQSKKMSQNYVRPSCSLPCGAS